jgi:hypothetical protein
VAARNGHLDILKILVKYGIDVHASYELMLWSSAHSGHLNIVRYLVEEHQADISQIIGTTAYSDVPAVHAYFLERASLHH